MALIWQAVKDPDEVKDYGLDWSALLGTDTIATSMWSITDGAGLVINSQDKDTKTTTVWLSSGTLNYTYLLLNRITTAGGRTFDQTVNLVCRAK